MNAAATCLNCDNPVTGYFCSNCGQAVIHSKLTVWQLLRQFLSSTFNYDGRLFRSVKTLFFHPAALTLAYISGKRKQFVNPVQFYLFSSAIYFLIATATRTEPLIEINNGPNGGITVEESSAPIDGEIELPFESFEDYMTHQETLKDEERNNNIELLFIEKFYQLKSAYLTPRAVLSAVGKEIYARIPQLLIITIPFLALLSKLLFFRQKQYWFIDHLIFILHITTSLFIVLILTNLLSFASTKTDISAFNLFGLFLNMSWLGYYLVSVKKFFNKGWAKSVLYFFTLMSLQALVLFTAFLTLFALSLLQL